MFGKKKKELKPLTLEEVKKAAWNNAPIIIDKPENEYRVCMYCQFPMKRDLFIEDVKNPKQRPHAWTVDYVNIDKSGDDPKNLLAIHQSCKGHRKGDNQKRILKKYQDTKWLYPKGIK